VKNDVIAGICADDAGNIGVIAVEAIRIVNAMRTLFFDNDLGFPSNVSGIGLRN